MVLHLRAPKGKVSVEVMQNRAKYFDRTGKVNDHTIYLSGNLGKKCPGICHVPVGKSNGRPSGIIPTGEREKCRTSDG